MHQQFEMLGRQPLSMLRDQLRCMTEIASTGCGREGDSFFYIEGVFYVDDRAGNLSTTASVAMLDNINRIHTYLLSNINYVYNGPGDGDMVIGGRLQPPPYEVLTRGTKYKKQAPDIRSMHTTVVEDLDLILGSKYLLCHENHCEHFVIFSDIRGHNKHIDKKYHRSYPRLIEQQKSMRRKCTVCDLLTPKYVIFGDRLAPQSPYYACEHCEFMLHYSKETNALLYDDFHIFPYYHDVLP